MKNLRIVLIGFALTLLAGCLTQERGYIALAKLKNGMTETELKAVLGEPQKIDTDADFFVWTYPSGTVFLRDGRVFSWKESEMHP